MAKRIFSTKTYTPAVGLSCCFRQWRALHSHCRYLHGYAIGVRVVFTADTLDERNWVQDFGGLKEFKAWLVDMFDHKTLIAADDPMRSIFEELNKIGVIDLRVLEEGVGCERFAMLIFQYLETFLKTRAETGEALNPNVTVHEVEVFEHDGNSAIYRKN